jgi:sugar phosphate isomerase/epimerase
MKKSKITYNYVGIEKRGRNTALRYIAGKLGVQFLKSLFKFLPGIDTSLKPVAPDEKLYVEIVPSFLGMLTKHWEIRPKLVEAFVHLGLSVRSMHAPYVDGGKVFQKARQSYLENILDVTEFNSLTLNCLYSHLDLYEMVAPKELDKVLIVHPIPASPDKSELEIIHSITRVTKKVLPLLHERNITLVVENLPWLRGRHERYSSFLGDAQFFERLLNELDDSHYGVLFDWGHANSYARFMYLHGIPHAEHQFTVDSLLNFDYQSYFVKKLKEKIYYAHINYNTAHQLDSKPLLHAKNFDSHGDLTKITEQEYEPFKKTIQEIGECRDLIGMTIESIPSYTNSKRRIQRYRDSVEILTSMLQSGS